MKLLHFIHTPRYSGAEILVRDLCICHRERGYSCAVASLNPSDFDFDSEIATLTTLGVNLMIPKRAPSKLGRIAHYAKTFLQYQPDVVFAHSIIPAMYCRIAALLIGSQVPIVMVLHSGSNDYSTFKYRFWEQILIFKTAAVIAVSSIVAEYYQKLFPRAPKARVISNGINLGNFAGGGELKRTNSRIQLGFQPEDRLIIQIGRISPIKNQIMTVRALKSLLKNDKSIKIWFVGLLEDQHYLAKLQQFIKTASLEPQVTILGPRNDISEILNACDLFVMPSISEAQAIALLEALASGIAVVASDIPVFSFAGNFAGVELVKLENDECFELAVSSSLSNNKFFKRDVKLFDINTTAYQYEDIAFDLQNKN